MKVLVCGGRNFNDKEFIHKCLELIQERRGVECLIHGGCSGVDTICGEWAMSKLIPVMLFPANWNGHGKAAGPIRNKSMVEFGKPDLLLAFPGGRGTNNMIKTAQSDSVSLWVPKY